MTKFLIYFICRFDPDKQAGKERLLHSENWDYILERKTLIGGAKISQNIIC